MVEPVHPDLRSRFNIDTRIFLNLFQDLTGVILLLVGNVPIESDAPVMTSSILRIYRLCLSEVLKGVGLHGY